MGIFTYTLDRVRYRSLSGGDFPSTLSLRTAAVLTQNPKTVPKGTRFILGRTVLERRRDDPEESSHGREGRGAVLRLPASDGCSCAGRLGSECQANLSAVHGGAVDRAHQAPTQDRSPSARNHGDRHSSEPVLEHGLYEPQAGGRPSVPHFDGGGPVHAGVRLFGCGSCHDGDARGAGSRESESGTRTFAGQPALRSTMAPSFAVVR
jgi:hypothetical protein